VLWPLDEGHAVAAELVGEQVGLLAVEAVEAEEVEVTDRELAVLVAPRDREGRARDRRLHAERAGGAAHEGRLAGPELA
jgi:hypothetical protein